VTQAVFLVLARKAAKMGPDVVLSGWLFRTTRYAAAVALRAEVRRRHHEQRAAASRLEAHDPDAGSPRGIDVIWKDVEPLLDDAMEKLGSSDRNIVLLRFYQKMSFREVGVTLNISDDTAQKRVSRALQKLRQLIDKRGVTLGSTAVLAGVLGENAVEAAPAGMSANLASVFAGQTAASAAAASLATAVAKGLPLGVAKVVVGLALLLVLTTAFVLSRRQPQTAVPVAQAVGANSIVGSVDEPTMIFGQTPPPMSLDVGNGVTLDLVGIPPGEFTQGGEQRIPRHRVRISYGFYLGKFEVTQAQWASVMGVNPSRFGGDVRRPVEQVSWNECQEFCRRLSQMTGRKVRLPSESEWEHACRAGTATVWSFGSNANDLANYAWQGVTDPAVIFTRERVTQPTTMPLANSEALTHPVGLKLPNPWGLHDMYGNVWEWCQDMDAHPSNYDRRTPDDGSARTVAGDSDKRVARGAAFGNAYLQETFSSYGFTFPPDSRRADIGLRIVVETSAPARQL
jgi:RNA polymerase sigma factor (sigma-70 family)